MIDRPIQEDIEALEKILDGLSDKIPQTRDVLEKIKTIQIDLFDLKKELERSKLLKNSTA